MKRSPFRHPIAVLRKALDLRRKELADLIGSTVDILKNIELGRANLGKEMAHQISSATYVNVEWLLAGDPKEPIRAADGHPYLFDHFELAQARRHFRPYKKDKKDQTPESEKLPLDDEIYEFGTRELRDRLKEAYLKATKHGREQLFMWRLEQVFDLTEKECVRDLDKKEALKEDMLEPIQYAAEQASGIMKKRKLKGRRARLGGWIPV